ncbi:MAG: SDR family oxidoreductase [Pseudomonas sp.]|uniref:SDR family oxidoreductase n=1 Tax=Pseudomonas sp. TaxID=306 RepID=UPI0039827B6E
MRFQNKVAIVTGAGQGIGEAYAKALAAEGAAVVIAEIDAGNGERVAGEIESAGGRALFVRTDVSSPSSTEALAVQTVEHFGGIDLLINNAAIFAGMRREGLLKVDYAYYQRFMEVNMNGALIVTRAVYEHMVKRGGGAIVNQSSTAAYLAGNYYSIAKTGLNALTIGLAKELGPLSIRINGIAPGPTDTMATQTSVPAERLQSLLSSLPLKRIGQTDDIVKACLFLLSDDASWITGQTWCVDGGQILKI